MRYIFQKFNNREDGFTLVEVIIALVIMGIIAIGLFSVLGTSFIGTGVADERATAKNLAESQMEYVKGLTWNEAGIYSLDDTEIASEYPGYSASIVSVTYPHNYFDEDTQEIKVDANLQKITISVSHHDEEVLRLEGYKLR